MDDFEEPAFEDPLLAVVQKIEPGSGRLLLKFNAPVQIAGQEYSYAVTSIRYEDTLVEQLLIDGSIICNLTCIPPDRFRVKNPFDTSWWRGGAAAVASVAVYY